MNVENKKDADQVMRKAIAMSFRAMLKAAEADGKGDGVAELKKNILEILQTSNLPYTVSSLEAMLVGVRLGDEVRNGGGEKFTHLLMGTLIMLSEDLIDAREKVVKDGATMEQKPENI